MFLGPFKTIQGHSSLKDVISDDLNCPWSQGYVSGFYLGYWKPVWTSERLMWPAEDGERGSKATAEPTPEEKKENGMMELSNQKNSLHTNNDSADLIREWEERVGELSGEGYDWNIAAFCHFVSATTETYWAYDSPVLHFVNWEENDIPAYVNDSEFFDAPTANHIVF